MASTSVLCLRALIVMSHELEDITAAKDNRELNMVMVGIMP